MKTFVPFRVCGTCALAAALLIAAWPATASAAPSPIRVLIFSGQNNHDWRQTTPKLRSILTASGRFQVQVAERPDQCDAATFARCDVIVSDWNNWGDARVKEWPAQTRADFLDFIRKGGGYVAVHAGGASFADWPEYQKLTGGSWGKNTGHGAVHTFEVKWTDSEHPITRGLQPFSVTDELWHHTAIEPGVRVLAKAFSARDTGGSGQDEPVLYVTEFGKGRGLTLLLGHQAAAMDAEGFETLLLRGTEWAATGEMTLPAPTEAAALDFGAALNAIKGYRFGDSREALAAAEKLVNRVSQDASARQKCAASLAIFVASDATLEAREFACRQLSLIGSAADVPVFARLLPDPQLSYFARLGLERIPGEESRVALRAALSTLTGPLRIGVINSLAVLRDRPAVTEIARLVTGADADTAGAAVRALGVIGGPEAARALTAAEATLPPALAPAVGPALLQCAAQFLAEGKNGEASVLLEKLVAPQRPPSLRLAAFPLYVSSLGDKGAELVLSALAQNDKSLQAAAIRALRTTRSAALVRASADRLDSLSPDLQVPVIALLGERGDAVALPAVAKAVSSDNTAVRRAAIVALGTLGNASTVPLLAGLTVPADNEEKKLLTEALTRLPGDGVDAALVTELKNVLPAGQRVLIRALAARGSKSAIPALVTFASAQDPQVRREAIAGLEKIGDASACPPLVQLLDQGGDTGPVESALAGICRREGAVDPIVRLLAASSPRTQALLLGVLGSVGGSEALQAVRKACQSGNAEIRAAAVRALADWPDAAPLDDLVSLGTTEQDARLKALALRGVARLVPQAKTRPADQLVELLNRAIGAAPVAEKKALVGALGEVRSVSALQAAAARLKEPELADEAGMAVLKIVEAVGRSHRAEARVALEQVVASCKNPAITEQASSLSLKFGDLENLSLGATATSPDGVDADGASGGDQAAIDGDPNTYWDEVDNQKLYILRVQLKKPSRVVFLRIMGWQHENFAPRDFEVRCDDQVVKKVENARYKNNWLDVDLAPANCSSVELRITRAYGPSPAIRELEIYGKP